VCTPERRRYAAGLAVATQRGLLRISTRDDAAAPTPDHPVTIALTRDRRDVERFVIDAASTWTCSTWTS
jgi:hypothetical protein